MSMQRGRAISKYAVIAVACAISVLAFEATRVFAKNTGNFGGDFTIVKVIEQGENEVVKVSLRVINNSGADVKECLHHNREAHCTCSPRANRSVGEGTNSDQGVHPPF